LDAIGQERTENSQLADILRTLSPEQLDYVRERINHKTDSETARVLKMRRQTISEWGEEVQTAVNLIKQDGIILAKERMRRAINDAVDVKLKGLESRNEYIRQSTSSEIIERNLGKAAQPLTGADGGVLTINIAERKADTDG
jgi:hypothetical protein